MSPLAIPLGLLIGLTLGSLGGGGSILTVPVPALVYGVGQDLPQPPRVRWSIVGVTALLAVVPHARAGRVRFGQGLTFGAGGSFAGSTLAAHVSRRCCSPRSRPLCSWLRPR